MLLLLVCWQQCMLKLMAHHVLDNASVFRSTVVLLAPVMALDLEVWLCDGTSEKANTHTHTHTHTHIWLAAALLAPIVARSMGKGAQGGRQ